MYEGVRYGNIMCGYIALRKGSRECPNYLHWNSFSLSDFTTWASTGGNLPFIPHDITQINGLAKPIKAPDDEDLEIKPVTNRFLYKYFEISSPDSYISWSHVKVLLEIPILNLKGFMGKEEV